MLTVELPFTPLISKTGSATFENNGGGTLLYINPLVIFCIIGS
jgi:hypothetical protein